MLTRDPHTLKSMDGDELAKALDSGVSILSSLKCGIIRKKLFFVALFARLVAFLTVRRADNNSFEAQRKSLRKLLQKYTPVRFDNASEKPSNYKYDGGSVLAFNHPSLGDIPRLILFSMQDTPDRRIRFAINLAWYEALNPIKGFLDNVGIDLSPIITPKLKEEIIERHPEFKDELSSIEKKLIMNYGADVVKSLNNHEVVIVAPTATRKQKIFDNSNQCRGIEKYSIDALSFIAKYCTNKKRISGTINDSAIIPLCVMPPIGAKPGLNLKQEYEFCSTDAFRFHESSFDLRGRTPAGNNLLEAKYMDSLKICCEQCDRLDMIW